MEKKSNNFFLHCVHITKLFSMKYPKFGRISQISKNFEKKKFQKNCIFWIWNLQVTVIKFLYRAKYLVWNITKFKKYYTDQNFRKKKLFNNFFFCISVEIKYSVQIIRNLVKISQISKKTFNTFEFFWISHLLPKYLYRAQYSVWNI